MAAWLVEAVGSWAPVFYTAAAFDICGALLAILVLRRMTLPRLASAETGAVPAPVAGGSG